MAQNGTDATDQEESTKPVSFLLSHFENLAHVKQQSSSPEPTSASPSLQATRTNDGGAVVSRASLDLPRPDSEWSPAHRPARSHHGRTPPQPTHNERSPGSAERRHPARPVSMVVNSTSASSHSLTFDAPQPSPRNLAPTSYHTNARPAADTPRHGDAGGRNLQPQRAATPISGRPDPGYDGRHGTDNNNSEKALKSSSVPPPVNRADKPKIPAKKSVVPANVEASTTSLAPSSQRTSFDDRVSPFNTPPSSPERQSPTRASNGQRSRHSRGLSHTPESARYSITEPQRAPSPFKPKSTETKEPGFDRRTKPTANSQRSVTQPAPPPPPPLRRNATLPSRQSSRDSPSRAEANDAPPDRPGLPPRSQAADTPRDTSRRTPSVIKPDVDPISTSVSSHSQTSGPETPKASLQVPGGDSKPPIPPSPRRSANTNAGSAQNGSIVRRSESSRSPSRSQDISSMIATASANAPQQTSKVTREEAVELPLQIDESTVSRTDYPDASHTNRRPPYFKTGTRGIHTKVDTRVFDVCGQYVSTTGYFTRAWDLVSGEPVMSLNHGESTKGVSLAFKPGRSTDDEGRCIWVGTNAGELLEVDLTTQSVVDTRMSPSRREIIKIYRYRKELWTLDDEGRLLIWPPDESGTPNLQYSYDNPYDRVAKGHTFSMLIGDLLWHASGKEVRVYRPSRDDSSFQVLKSPLGKNHSGDVTCGTATRDGKHLYLGHADGKVTIYSTKDYTCVGVVSLSLYKISSLVVVGDYLWAGYKTGMIYVYDTSTNPWTVKKDWLAHENGVCEMVFDPSGIWTVNRMQVVSLGVDNYIRVWDGLLEDDWLESRMQSRDVDYCDFREITASVLTWNAGATVPGNLRDNNFIRDAIHPENPPDILVFGFQELVNLEDKKITAKSLLKSSKKKDHADAEHMSRQYRVWRDYLASCIHEFMPLDQPYVLLHTASLIGLFTCVFVKQEERQRIKSVSAAEVKRGMGGLHGNKGALVLRLIIDDSSVCLVNCHLAAGQTQTANRNNDVAAILESDALPTESSATSRIDHFVGGGDGSMILDHEICVLNGDLNYRIDSIPRNTVLEAIKSLNLPKLLDRDQLLASRRKNPSFRLRSFNEMPITFAPTYKYDVGTDNYDSSEKRRAPAWCDRLLYRGVGRVKQLEYRRHEVKVSDHRPVGGLFKMRVKTISTEERTTTWELCQKDFVKERSRLVTDASVEYLVRVVGVSPQEARSLLSSANI